MSVSMARPSRAPLLSQRFSRIWAMMALLLVAGCVSATPYQPAGDRGGYTDHKVEENRFLVSFRGNSETPRDVVETYLLYRAAEVTLASGNDWFRIADQGTDVSRDYRGVSTGFFGKKRFRRHRKFRRGFRHRRFGFRSGFFFGGFRTTTVIPRNRFEASANILAFKGDKPAEDPDAYDARQVLDNLGPRIVRPDRS
ncbi:MAG: hypothetical protein AAF415_12715 [Pseudomonadota bacterium]